MHETFLRKCIYEILFFVNDNAWNENFQLS